MPVLYAIKLAIVYASSFFESTGYIYIYKYIYIYIYVLSKNY